MSSSRRIQDPLLEILIKSDLSDEQQIETCNCTTCGSFCSCRFNNGEYIVLPYRPTFCGDPCPCVARLDCSEINQCSKNTFFYNIIE